MSHYAQMMPPDPKRLYRTTRDKLIGGVCAGIANYLGWQIALLRVGVVLSMLVIAPFTVCAYLVLWAVTPKEPSALFRDPGERSFWQSVNVRPGGTVGDLSRKFHELDERLARLERKVTAPDFTLDRDIGRLRST